MFFHFFSLRLRALVFALLTVVGMSLAYTINASRLVLEGGMKEVEGNIQQTAELLNLVASPYATMGGLPTLMDFFEAMLVKNENRGVLYLVIQSDTGEVLVAAGKVPEPLPLPDENLRAAAMGGIVHARNPILLRGNRVGSLQFGLSTQHLLDTRAEIQRDGLIISSAIGALILMVVFAVGLSLMRRIDRLISASQLIASGDYGGMRAEERGQDEISQLARNFNRMAEAISAHLCEVEASRSQVQQMNASLESTVAQRTSELASKNSELGRTIEYLNQTRESLIRSEKLAGLGAIVAGVAHEMNTPIGNALTVSSTLTEKTRQMQTEMEAGLKRSTLQTYMSDSRMAAELIERNLKRAAELVQSFKQVAVDQSSEQRRRFQLNETVHECLVLLHPMLKRTPYQVEVDIPDHIEMDSYPGPLAQVITNLVNNAVIHGFDDRDHGVIHIRADRFDGNGVRIVFSDDGHGIPAEYLDRIFDPFFTTRLGRGGSGLGLNIIYNIVTQVLGGSVDVRSQIGEGTTFILLLPLQGSSNPKHGQGDA